MNNGFEFMNGLEEMFVTLVFALLAFFIVLWLAQAILGLAQYWTHAMHLKVNNFRCLYGAAYGIHPSRKGK
jgi:hypothetical protein